MTAGKIPPICFPHCSYSQGQKRFLMHQLCIFVSIAENKCHGRVRIQLFKYIYSWHYFVHCTRIYASCAYFCFTLILSLWIMERSLGVLPPIAYKTSTCRIWWEEELSYEKRGFGNHKIWTKSALERVKYLLSQTLGQYLMLKTLWNAQLMINSIKLNKSFCQMSFPIEL